MNRVISLLFGTFILLFICSCGEDRTYEYIEKTERNHWIMDVLKNKYLWADSIKEDKVNWQNFFIDPHSFLNEVIDFAPIKDKWSWCSVDTIKEDHYQRGFFNHLDSYGIDFMVMSDPTRATSRQYVRVTSVIDGSPADRCGIKRGDFIGYIDNVKINSSDIDKLVSGKNRTLEVYKLSVNDDATEYIWADEKTLYMEKSEYVEDVAFPVVKTFDVNDIKIAYIMCSRLLEGPFELNEQSTKYLEDLNSIIKNLKASDPKIVILDFRLCNVGSIEMANRLTSYMLNTTFQSQIFAQTIHNERRTGENVIYYCDPEALNNSLSPSDVFCITGDYTEGASEWVIRGLTALMGEEHVFKVGLKTAGQCVITENVESDFYVTLHPAVAFVADKYGRYDYNEGILPDLEIDESIYLDMYPYGDENEVVLSLILNEINNMF